MDYTPQQLGQLRRMTGLDADDSVYTDAALSSVLDQRAGDFNAAAAVIWDEKAAAAARLYDFAADGGDYKRSQLVEQYQAQAAKFRARASFGFPGSAS